MVVEYPAGKRSEAIDDAVKRIRTEFVLPLEPDAGMTLRSLRVLQEFAWNAPAAYPSLARCGQDFEPLEFSTAAPFCPYRLRRVNYIGPSALVARAAYLEVGGWGSGAWDLWLRLGRLKPAPEATYLARSDPPVDPRPDVERGTLLATFYAQGTPATTHWRCSVPARHLPAAVDPALPTLSTRGDGPRFSEHEGTAVFQFPGDAAREVMVSLMQEQGIPVVIEVDDDYLSLGRVGRQAGWVESASDSQGPHSVERHARMTATADGVIVSTDALASRYRSVNQNVHVCRNSLDVDVWPDIAKPRDDVIRVGWFASGSHRADAPLVVPALEWASRQPGVEVVAMGVGTTRFFDESFGTVVEERRWWPFPYRALPFESDIERYWSAMTQLDIGLAPVVAKGWSIYRSDLKALEYAMAGACPVLSDAPPYAAWQNGRGCLKAGTPQEFLEAVKRLVRNPSLASTLAAEAREYALAERTIEQNVWRWREAIDAIGRQRSRRR